MEIPKVEIEALCAYVEIDLENGVQMNDKEWRESLEKVRKWLDAVEHLRAPDVCRATNGEHVWVTASDYGEVCGPCGIRR